jgi:hypothetical protein
VKALGLLADDLAEPELRSALPVLRGLARNWQLAGKVGLSHPLLPTCLQVISQVEQQTGGVKSIPIASASDPRSQTDLPVVRADDER